MPCTTLLIGKNASYDGSTIVARNEDSCDGEFTSKEFAVALPEQQPRVYTSKISHVQIELPADPLRCTAVPDAPQTQGIWAAAGINAAGVAMSATETISSNARVLGADPLVLYEPAAGEPGTAGYQQERVGGIGEEDMVTLVLPYVHTAREGVERLGALLARHGTYEMNGIAFSDADEVWWMETVGGHHWIACRVPDDAYVAMPNQLGIDRFDLADAEGAAREHMASPDLRAWMAENRLDLTRGAAPGAVSDVFNPRHAFGSASSMDHVYNTPRAWYMQRCLNPGERWDGPDAAFGPEADDIPWCRLPERKITIEDVKDVLSSHYEGTPFDPYGSKGDAESRTRYRCVGINRTSQLAVLQLRPAPVPERARAVQWMAFGSNPFNALVPLYAQVGRAPAYLAGTTARVDTGNFYWANRLIGALADACHPAAAQDIERYQVVLGAMAHAHLHEVDAQAAALDSDAAAVEALLAEANDRMAEQARHQTDELLARVLFLASERMKNRFGMSDT